MKLKINETNNLKKVKLVRNCVILTSIFPFALTGCNEVNTSDYYLVHNNEKYYICTKSDLYSNSCDYEYKSIINNEIVGYICSLKNNFDYQTHRLSTEFLSELQVVKLDEVIDDNNISKNDIMNIAKSDEINSIGDKYFKSRMYNFEYSFDNYLSSTLKIYKSENDIILGYDMSPKRLNGTNDYVYSLLDNDVIKLSDKKIEIYNINDFFNGDNYISYTAARELSNDKKLQKVMKK